MNAKASFIIPAYNAALWISKTVFSCRQQAFKQVEIIVVNDGSTDETKDILEWHAKEDSRVKLFHMEQRKGRSAARNFGNRHAQSDVLMVLDADDLATRNRARDTVDFFALKKPDLAYGSFFMMDSMGTAMQKVLSGPFDPIEAKAKKMNFICHSTMAYTQKVADTVRYEDGVYTDLGLDDWKFQWEAYRSGFTIKNMKPTLCYYRITNSGAMATRDEKAVEAAKDSYLAKI